jgi:hypothetical protein
MCKSKCLQDAPMQCPLNSSFGDIFRATIKAGD